MILVGYLVEGAILFCWYKFILCKELHQKHILKRSIKILKCNMKVILKNIFFLYETDRKQQDDFEYIKNKLLEEFSKILEVFIWCLLCPIITRILVEKMNFGVIKYITYIVIIIGLIVGRLKEITQQYIKTINEYIDGILLPLENRPQLIRKDESKRIEIKQTVSKFKIGMYIAATLSIFGMLLTLKVLILPHIINNKVVAVLLIILLFAMMTFEKRRIMLKKKMIR